MCESKSKSTSVALDHNWKITRLLDKDGVTESALVNVVTKKVYCHKPSEILIASEVELEGVLKVSSPIFWEQEVDKLDDLHNHYYFNGRLRNQSFKSSESLCAV